MKLRAIFHELDRLSARDVFYHPDRPLSLDSECLLFDVDGGDDPDETPPDAARLGLREGLSIREVSSIRENARLQGRAPTPEELLRAYVFYLDHDAFIEFV